MIKAFYRMRNGQQKQKITAKIYEVLKIEFSEAQRENCLKQVSDGTHTWLGGKNVRERVANGTHPFLGGEVSRKAVLKQLKDGIHSSQIKKTCSHCGKTCSSGMYKRWHGDQCKLK